MCMSLNLFSDTTFKEQIILLLSTRHQILLYNIPTQDLITLHTGLDKGASIDFHYKEKYIFWAGEEDGRIHRATLTLDGTKSVFYAFNFNYRELYIDPEVVYATGTSFCYQTYSFALPLRVQQNLFGPF